MDNNLFLILLTLRHTPRTTTNDSDLIHVLNLVFNFNFNKAVGKFIVINNIMIYALFKITPPFLRLEIETDPSCLRF